MDDPKNLIWIIPAQGCVKMCYDISGLHVLTDKKLAHPRSVTEIVKLAILGGASVIQLRDKTASSEEMISLGRQLKKLTSDKIPLIVNDNIDVAIAISASGIHVGQTDLSANRVRRKIGDNMILGVSASSLQQALKAQDDGANYLGVGPIFPTPSKDDAAPAIGLLGLEKIKKAVSIPIIAIGGITLENAIEVSKIADGVAVISAVMQATNPEHAVREILRIIENGGVRLGGDFGCMIYDL